MDISIGMNSEKLFALMKSFYELAGIKISIYDNCFHEVLTYPQEDCGFCARLRSYATNKAKCDACTTMMGKMCVQNKKTLVYTCHAGLTEVIAPLEINGMEIGYVICGQVTNRIDREGLVEDVIERCKDYGIDDDKINELLCDICYISSTQLDAVVQMVNVMTSYIILQELVYVSEKPVSILIMDYIRNNLEEDLSVESLCKKFAMSRSKLYNVTRTCMPEGVAKFIRKERLKKAEMILEREPQKTIRQVAQEVGFKSYENFLRLVKKKDGQ